MTGELNSALAGFLALGITLAGALAFGRFFCPFPSYGVGCDYPRRSGESNFEAG